MASLILVTVSTLEQRIVQAGETAPAFTITTDGGQSVSVNSFGGKLLILNFWATWCPPCVQEMPSLVEFAEKMKAKGVVVLGVSVDKNEKTYKQFLQSARVTFVTARDPEANISSSYGTFKYPETYVIDQKGNVLEKFIGPENWSDPKVLERIQRHL
ncbi:MAG: TlpA family protein disulfide reductase [Acidobacteria bacterium]|nr:TlpA family protein disulfide reductase [Acidobacteriota bacterium]